MIIPNVRASFGKDEAELLIRALAERTRWSQRAWEDRLAEEGLDSLLDRPETLSAIVESGSLSTVSPKLTFYVMVRHTLLESGLDNPEIADYVAALLVEFAVNGRAYRIASYDDANYHYLVDLVAPARHVRLGGLELTDRSRAGVRSRRAAGRLRAGERAAGRRTRAGGCGELRSRRQPRDPARHTP